MSLVLSARSLRASVAVLALVCAGLIVTPAVRADTAPPAGTPATVSADRLPTWQINGVVWSQAVANNVVFAGGQFTRARPPGVTPGVPARSAAQNFFAYDITDRQPPPVLRALGERRRSRSSSPPRTSRRSTSVATSPRSTGRPAVASRRSTSATGRSSRLQAHPEQRGRGHRRDSGRRSTSAATSPRPAAPPGPGWRPSTPPTGRWYVVGTDRPTTAGSSGDDVEPRRHARDRRRRLHDAEPRLRGRHGIAQHRAGAALCPGWPTTRIRDGGTSAASTASSPTATHLRLRLRVRVRQLRGRLRRRSHHRRTRGRQRLSRRHLRHLPRRARSLYSVGHAHSCQWIGGVPGRPRKTNLRHALAIQLPDRTNSGPDSYGWDSAVSGPPRCCSGTPR